MESCFSKGARKQNAVANDKSENAFEQLLRRFVSCSIRKTAFQLVLDSRQESMRAQPLPDRPRISSASHY